MTAESEADVRRMLDETIRLNGRNPKDLTVDDVSDLVGNLVGTLDQGNRKLSRHLSFQINHVANAARESEIERVNETRPAEERLQKLWIAERDACVHCLALSGDVVEKGEGFDGGKSFDPRGAPPVPPQPGDT
jgi:hypothetical protein